MPSPRRMRLVTLAALGLTILFIFYVTRMGGSTVDGRSQGPFYDKTVTAMDNKREAAKAAGEEIKPLDPADRDGDGDIDADDEIMGVEMRERLKAAELRAKQKANEKAGLRPDPPSNVVGVGSSAHGQDASEEGDTKASEEERDTQSELTAILKKSPTIIFSKSYCPHSKRAKQILLDKYSITPEPFVVELDQHEMGSKLQDALKEKTGRRTVPNILINGVSIGGGDEVAALDEDGKLADKILELGSKRIEVAKKPGSRGGSRSDH